MLFEPPLHQADLHFRLLGFPVRVHPYFWIVTLFMGMQGGSTPPAVILNWILAVFLSILIHELGHAVLQRYYGGRPRIVLYGMGGLAICEDCERSTYPQILISLAGPFAGFLFALLLLSSVRVAGHGIGLALGDAVRFNSGGINDPTRFSVFGLTLGWDRLASPQANEFLLNLLWINLLWGVMNLLPIYPLDGGRVVRELCLLGQPRAGIVLSLQISMIAAGAMVLVGLSRESFFTAVMFGYLAYSSYQTLAAYRSGWR